MSKRKYIILVLVLLVVLGLSYGFADKFGWFGKLKSTNRNLNKGQTQAVDEKIKLGEDAAKMSGASKTDYVNSQIYLAQQYYALGQLDKSRNYYNEALKVDSENEAALTGLSIVLNEAGDAGGAQAALEKAIKAHPESYDTWIRYIDFKDAHGASKEELDTTYQNALAATGRYIDLLTKDAQFQEKIGNVAQAISLWEEAGRKYPQNAAIYQQEADRLKASLPK